MWAEITATLRANRDFKKSDVGANTSWNLKTQLPIRQFCQAFFSEFFFRGDRLPMLRTVKKIKIKSTSLIKDASHKDRNAAMLIHGLWCFFRSHREIASTKHTSHICKSGFSVVNKDYIYILGLGEKINSPNYRDYFFKLVKNRLLFLRSFI